MEITRSKPNSMPEKSGMTTGLVLEALGHAMQEPGLVVRLRDHDGQMDVIGLRERVMQTVAALKLYGFKIALTDTHVCISYLASSTN